MNKPIKQKCKYCGNEMRLDDTDFHFKGCEDKYWVCDNCSGSCIEKIRYAKSWKKEWYREDPICKKCTSYYFDECKKPNCGSVFQCINFRKWE